MSCFDPKRRVKVVAKVRQKLIDGRRVYVRDRLTLLRCVVYWKSGTTCERKTMQLWDRYRRLFPNDNCLSVGHVESMLQIGITVLNPKFEIIRQRTTGYSRSLVVLYTKLCQFQYVLSTMTGAALFRCEKCGRIYSAMKHLKVHRKATSEHCVPFQTKTKLRAGSFLFGSNESLWMMLAAEGFVIPSYLRFPPYLASWDFESLGIPCKIPIGQHSMLTQEQRPISFAIFCNLPNYEPFFYASDDPSHLLSVFWRELHEISDAAFRIVEVQWKPIIRELRLRLKMCYQYSNRNQSRFIGIRGISTTPSQSIRQREGQNAWIERRIVILETLLSKLYAFMRRLPCLAMNFQGYDGPLIKRYLAPKLVDDPNCSVIKKGLKIVAIRTPSLVLLDVLSYLSPGFSLESFLAAYLPTHLKGEGTRLKSVFPYEWLDSFEKLSATELPPKSAFVSRLKGGGITEEEYCYAKNIWKSLGQNATMLDYLRLYNIADVQLMVPALENMCKYWKELAGVMPLRESVSTPGMSLVMARKYMAQNCFVLLPSPGFEPAHRLIETALIGGLACIFHRYSEVGVTRINERKYGQNAKIVASIQSWDLNSLYLTCLANEKLPAGDIVYYSPSSGFDSLSIDSNEYLRSRSMMSERRGYRSEIEWLAFKQAMGSEAETCNENHFIQHALTGGQVNIAGYMVDGFCASCLTIYEYFGAYYHGYHCALCRAHAPKPKSLEEKYEREVLREETEEKVKVLSRLPRHKFVSICSCQWEKMKKQNREIRKFCSGIFPKVSKKRLTPAELISAVEKDAFFGIVSVDILVPENLTEMYENFPPFFVHSTLKRCMLSDEMQKIAKKFCKLQREQRVLLSALEATKTSIITPLIRAYLQRGFKITRVYEAVQFTMPKILFHKLGERVSKLRIDASKDPSLRIIGDTAKIAANSVYGKLCQQSSKFRQTKYVSLSAAKKLVTRANFDGAESMTEDVLEVSLKMHSVQNIIPRSLAVFILGWAKLYLLRLHWFLLDHLHPGTFRCLACDTDAHILELATVDMESLVKSSMLESWNRQKSSFFPQNDDISEQKRLGIFKLEYRATSFVGLSAKCYCLQFDSSIDKSAGPEEIDTVREKYSAKGVSKRHNDLRFSMYKETLQKNGEMSGRLINFRKFPDGSLFLTEQAKVALSCFYAKRIVLSNGVDTLPHRFPR